MRVLQASADDLVVLFWQVAAARLPDPDDRQAPLPRRFPRASGCAAGANPGSGGGEYAQPLCLGRAEPVHMVVQVVVVVSRGHGQRSAVPRIRLPGMSLRPVRRAGEGRQTVLWLPAAGESACRPRLRPGLRVIRLARRAGRVVPGGVATSGAAAVILVTGVPGSQHRAGGSAAVQRGGRRGADAGPADRGGGGVRGDWGQPARRVPGLSGVGLSRRPGLRPVLNAWARAAAVVLPAGRDRCARWCRAPGPRDRGSAVTGGMVAAVVACPGPGLGGNDHGGFPSQFGQQVFEN